MHGPGPSRQASTIVLSFLAAATVTVLVLKAQQPVADPAQGGGNSPIQDNAREPASKMGAPQLDGSQEELRLVCLASVISSGLSTLTLLAVLGLYFRRAKPGHRPADNATPPPKPYDDRQLRDDLAQLQRSVERLSQQLSLLAVDRPSQASAPACGLPQVAASPPRDGPAVQSLGGLAGMTEDYERTRANRSSWRDFEARHFCERFECTNVRERLSRPEEPLRFQSSPSGVYLAADAGADKYAVFPFFSADPMQLYHDGAMSEVYDFPFSTRAGTLRVSQPAVFTRADRQWFLQSRGRLEE